MAMGNVRVFSATNGERELGPIRLHDGAVWGLAFSEDGTRLASGGEDGDVQVIDAETGEQLASPARSRDEISSVLFVDGRLLAGGADGIVRIWDGATLEGELGPHAAGVTAMALLPAWHVGCGRPAGRRNAVGCRRVEKPPTSRSPPTTTRSGAWHGRPMGRSWRPPATTRWCSSGTWGRGRRSERSLPIRAVPRARPS